MNKYELVCGLEVHVELKTKSKMFCSCSADYFGQKPNTHTCPVCLGLPGALPVPNKKAIEWCIMIAQALDCEINLFSKFDRKNYFYPDLAKGYQISQYDLPFGKNGHMVLSNGKKIGVTRVHMEEDTGKLTHETIDGENVSLIDFNRSGVPLVEIVTEPDFDNANDVKEYLQRLQQIVRYLDVSDADMEKGNMRLEPNISLRREGQTGLPNYKVEVKNINSFNFVGRAIEFEIKRQAEILDKNERPAQETRGFVEATSSTKSQRSKEDAQEYRYFPEPDIPPLRFTQNYIDGLKDQMPELPEAKQKRFEDEYLLPKYDAEILTRSITASDYFENAVVQSELIIKKGEYKPSSKDIANKIIQGKINIKETTIPQLIHSIQSAKTVAEIDDEIFNKIIDKVISENEKAVSDFKSGKEPVIMYLVGQVMRQFPEKIDSGKVKESLLSKLK